MIMKIINGGFNNTCNCLKTYPTNKNSHSCPSATLLSTLIVKSPKLM